MIPSFRATLPRPAFAGERSSPNIPSSPRLVRGQHEPVEPERLTWTARLTAEMAGVHGSFQLPWASVVGAQSAVIPAATPGSGAITLKFADGNKLDLAFSGNYGGFRAALTRLPRTLPGLSR